MQTAAATEPAYDQLETVRDNLKDLLEARGDDVSYIEEHGNLDRSKYSGLVALTTNKTVVFFALSNNAVKTLVKVASEVSEKDLHTKCWWCDATNTTAKSSKGTPLETGKNTFILILSESPSNKSAALFESLEIQIFYKHELLYNPLKHALVPKHRKLSASEAAAVLKEYRIDNPRKMPLILKTDVIARWLGVRAGDIVEIQRTGGNYYYRYCM